ncbi:MAG: hypothetical protein ACYSU0_15970, partial [Planctomycetota bacterium]
IVWALPQFEADDSDEMREAKQRSMDARKRHLRAWTTTFVIMLVGWVATFIAVVVDWKLTKGG